MKILHSTHLCFAVFIAVTTAVSGNQFFTTTLTIDHGHALLGNVIKTLPLFKPDCMDQCQQTLPCFSMNFYKNKNGSAMCDLNRSTKQQSPEHFTKKSGYEYAEIPEKRYCIKNDCMSAKEALPNSVYMFNFTRFRLWNLLKTWDEAQKHCKSLGDELASFRSKAESSFAFETMILSTKKHEFAPSESLVKLRMDGLDSELRLISLKNGARIVPTDHALYLDGIDDYAKVSPFVMYNSSFTFGVWVNMVNSSRTRMIFSDDKASGKQRSFQFRISESFFTVILYDQNNRDIEFNSLRAVPRNEWVHLAFTYDLNTGNGTFYFNGTLEKYEVKVLSTHSKELQRYHPMTVMVGRAIWNQKANFHGSIRDLNLIAGVLTHDGITRLKDGEKRAWIGLHDKTTEGVLQWSDGSPLTNPPLETTGNKEKKDCVALVGKHPGMWRARNCQEKSYYICKKK